MDNKAQTDNNEFDEVLETAIKSFQRNYNLKTTGTLDHATVKQMMIPRCGFPDHIGMNSENHKGNKLINNFSLLILQWNPTLEWKKPNISRFRLSGWALPLPIPNTRSIVVRAFEKWTNVTNFQFREVSIFPEIQISFNTRNHYDSHPFDGYKGTLAHAFPPEYGDLHNDADNKWSENPGANEVDLELVSIHEIGHVLGLGHKPKIPAAIMYPYIKYGGKKEGIFIRMILKAYANCMT